MKKYLWSLLALLLLLPQAVLAGEANEPEEELVYIACIDTGVSAQTMDPAAISEGKNYVFEIRDCTDRIGHGSAVAGLILAASDSEHVRIVPLVCYDRYPSGVSRRADIPTISQAIRDAVDVFGCRVINLSMGVAEDVLELREAVEYAERCGVVVVSAVGNSNVDAPELCYYPAAYPTVIGVGAADGAAPASFTQRQGVSVLAQGTEVEVLSIRNGADTEIVSGSSYACATISGICAGLVEGNPDKSPAEIRALLFSGAADIGEPGFDADSGWGIVRTAAEKERQPFLDVMPSAGCFDAVRAVYEYGLMNGVGNECFAPGLSISRGMVVAVLHRMAGSPNGGAADFADVPSDRYYAPAVGWAQESGIVNGVSKDLFCPDDPVSREQLLTMLHRFALRLYGAAALEAEAAQSDLPTPLGVSPFAAGAVNWALQSGLLQGGNDLPAPLEPATRAETAVLLERVIEKLLKGSG